MVGHGEAVRLVADAHERLPLYSLGHLTNKRNLLARRPLGDADDRQLHANLIELRPNRVHLRFPTIHEDQVRQLPLTVRQATTEYLPQHADVVWLRNGADFELPVPLLVRFSIGEHNH